LLNEPDEADETAQCCEREVVRIGDPEAESPSQERRGER
jgi:hypothetical protein